jgi:hypothetical protein
MKTWLARWYKLALLKTFIDWKKFEKKEPEIPAFRELSFLSMLQVSVLLTDLIGCFAIWDLGFNFWFIAPAVIITAAWLSLSYAMTEVYKGKKFRMAFLEGTLGTWIFIPFMPLYTAILLPQILVKHLPSSAHVTRKKLKKSGESVSKLPGGLISFVARSFLGTIAAVRWVFRILALLMKSLKENKVLNGTDNKSQS